MAKIEQEDAFLNFTAIDFETANKYGTSACSIGIVVVENGEITREFSHLIRPEPFFFYRHFINIHGITPDQVTDAPTFGELWPRMAGFFDTSALVAHNAHFDINVLKACLAYADIYTPLPAYHCTLQLSRRWLRHLPNHRLSTICEYLHIPLNHHDALSDARGAAKIMMALGQQRSGLL